MNTVDTKEASDWMEEVKQSVQRGIEALTGPLRDCTCQDHINQRQEVVRAIENDARITTVWPFAIVDLRLPYPPSEENTP